ncbi:MAG: hypothetical protein IJ438_00315 [Clostridia bacterium]|nr:hypothetical protein [Clostridia bacterium]
MKKTLLALLMALMLLTPALAETAVDPFLPFVLTAPADVVIEENEASRTYVRTGTRVVAMVIPRIPDEDPAASLPMLMAQFEAAAVPGEALVLTEGFHGLQAVTPDRLGVGVDQLTVMVLFEGDLLILAGYDLGGDEEKVQLLLDELLALATVNGVSILPHE